MHQMTCHWDLFLEIVGVSEQINQGGQVATIVPAVWRHFAEGSWMRAWKGRKRATAVRLEASSQALEPFFPFLSQGLG